MLVCSDPDNTVGTPSSQTDPLNGPWMPLTAPKVPWYVINCPNWMKTVSFMFIFIMFQNSWRTKIRKIWVYYIQPRQKPHFISQISPSHKIEQKRFCMQNLRMDLSFQEKKTIWKSDTWLLRYEAKSQSHFFWDTLYWWDICLT